jgi:hypothetical protein
MGVDRESSEGVVYIKTLSTEDAGKVFRSVSPEGVCILHRLFIIKKPGFLLSAMHSRTFRWFSTAPLVFLFPGLLPLQQILVGFLRQKKDCAVCTHPPDIAGIHGFPYLFVYEALNAEVIFL